MWAKRGSLDLFFTWKISDFIPMNKKLQFEKKLKDDGKFWFLCCLFRINTVQLQFLFSCNILHTFISSITLPMAFLLSSIPNLCRNSIIVPNFNRLRLNFSKNLSAVFNNFENIPEIKQSKLNIQYCHKHDNFNLTSINVPLRQKSHCF